MMAVVVTVFSVILTWEHVVVLVRVQFIVETGISLTEIDCLSYYLMLVSMSFAMLRELIYVVGTMLTHQLASIAVIFQLMLSMMILPTHQETQSMWDCILTVEVLIILATSISC